jgi:hypothetical protein
MSPQRHITTYPVPLALLDYFRCFLDATEGHLGIWDAGLLYCSPWSFVTVRQRPGSESTLAKEPTVPLRPSLQERRSRPTRHVLHAPPASHSNPAHWRAASLRPPSCAAIIWPVTPDYRRSLSVVITPSRGMPLPLGGRTAARFFFGWGGERMGWVGVMCSDRSLSRVILPGWAWKASRSIQGGKGYDGA